MRQHRFDFRSEQKPLRRQFVVQRLDAQPVACDEERFRIAIPDGKSEHAAQVLYAICTVFFVEMDDGLGIAVRAIAVAARDELLAQREMVVDFAIKHDPQRAVFVRNRLMTARNIDNAEPPHSDAHRAVGIKAVVVGSAMADHAAHFAQRRGVRPGVPSEFKNPSNPAHLVLLRVRRRIAIHSSRRESGVARQLFKQYRGGKLARRCGHQRILLAPLEKCRWPCRLQQRLPL